LTGLLPGWLEHDMALMQQIAGPSAMILFIFSDHREMIFWRSFDIKAKLLAGNQIDCKHAA
jgi:hypothetical protein